MTQVVPTDPPAAGFVGWARKAANSINDLIKRLGGYLPLTGGTLTGDLNVPDEAYGAGWNGSTEVPTKNAVYDKVEALFTSGTPLASFTVATLPSAAAPIRLIYVTDESGGAVPAVNDGTNWRRVTDRAVVS